MQHGIVTLRARRRGVTLIEAVLFISIALGLIVGGLIFFQQASLAQRTNDAVRTLSSIASETRALYQSQDDFGGLTAAVLNNAGAVPASVNAGATFTHEWAGDAGVFGTLNTGVVDGAGEFFTIVYENIPSSACVRLAQAVGGSGPIGNGIVNILVVNPSVAGTIAGAVLTPPTWTTPGVDPAAIKATDDLVTVTPDEAATLCGGSGTTDVAWVLTR